jgi:hypothetical protein
MKKRLGIAALKAFSIYAVVIVLMVIIAEFSPPFKKFLADLTGHHWTAKGVIGALLFIILTIIFNAKGTDDNLGKNINIAIVTAVSGSVIIFLFFIIHAM